jgi:hypothetical protein
MNLNLDVALEKMDQRAEKMKEIKKHPKAPSKLKIFTLEKIVKKNLQPY